MNGFSASTALLAFNDVERALSDVLDYIPYCEAHELVWSPKLAQIILDAGSQLDSLWRNEVPCSGDRSKLTMKQYATEFSGKGHDCFAGRFVVHLGTCDAEIIAPFSQWENTNAKLSWWDAYNELKHDRNINREKATLRTAVELVGGLLIALVRSRCCQEEVMHSGWFFDIRPYVVRSRLDNAGWEKNKTVAETRLFMYPVGASIDLEVKGVGLLKMFASERFHRWYKSAAHTKIRDCLRGPPSPSGGVVTKLVARWQT